MKSSIRAFCSLCVSVGEAKSTLERRSALHLFRLGEAMLRIVRNKNRPLLHMMRAWSVVAPHLVEVRKRPSGTRVGMGEWHHWRQFILCFSHTAFFAGGVSQRAPRVPEGRLLHPRCPDGGADELGGASTLPLQRGAVQALWAHHAAGALWRGRTGSGQLRFS